MSFLERYEVDESEPSLRHAVRDALVRALLPATAPLAVVIGIGLLIVGPLDGLPAEAVVNTELVEDRTPLFDGITAFVSNIGATLFMITTSLLIMVAIWWRSRKWWVAVVPGLALAVQAAVFMVAALVVGRERPDVEHLDEAPPTSSFPSGHTGASTAFYVSLALLSQHITSALWRRTATAVCLLIPLLVAYARLYRGMHSLSDVVVGMLNGVVCALLAWNYLRRSTRRRTDGTSEDEAQTRA